MRRFAILLLIVGMAGATVPPFLEDLYVVSDTLHVTTAEKGWLLGAYGGAYKLVIINPNNTTLLFRFSNVSGVIQETAGAYSTTVIEPPGGVLGVQIDSLFIDGSGSCTVDVRWWEVRQ